MKGLARYEEVERQVKPNHRLADFVIWGEVFSRVIGNEDNEFLKAWRQNTQQQNVTVVQNNPLAGLLVDDVFNYHRGEIETKIGPSQLYSDLREYAEKKS